MEFNRVVVLFSQRAVQVPVQAGLLHSDNVLKEVQRCQVCGYHKQLRAEHDNESYGLAWVYSIIAAALSTDKVLVLTGLSSSLAHAKHRSIDSVFAGSGAGNMVKAKLQHIHKQNTSTGTI